MLSHSCRAGSRSRSQICRWRQILQQGFQRALPSLRAKSPSTQTHGSRLTVRRRIPLLPVQVPRDFQADQFGAGGGEIVVLDA